MLRPTSASVTRNPAVIPAQGTSHSVSENRMSGGTGPNLFLIQHEISSKLLELRSQASDRLGFGVTGSLQRLRLSAALCR